MADEELAIPESAPIKKPKKKRMYGIAGVHQRFTSLNTVAELSFFAHHPANDYSYIEHVDTEYLERLCSILLTTMRITVRRERILKEVCAYILHVCVNNTQVVFNLASRTYQRPKASWHATVAALDKLVGLGLMQYLGTRPAPKPATGRFVTTVAFRRMFPADVVKLFCDDYARKANAYYIAWCREKNL